VSEDFSIKTVCSLLAFETLVIYLFSATSRYDVYIYFSSMVGEISQAL
jgi:hypothetical protein